jgi:hypothetical protein
MPRPLLVALVALTLTASAHAEDIDPKKMPAVKKALDKAGVDIARVRKIYDEATAKTVAEAKKALQVEADRLSKDGRPKEAVAVLDLKDKLDEELLKKAAPPRPNPAQAGAVSWNGHRYKVVQEPSSWHDARQKCEDAGGRLVIVNDAEEQAFLVALLGRSGLPVDNQQNRDYAAVWVGASDEVQEGNWLWVDGTPMTYSNWSPGNPKGGSGRHYPALGLHYGGKWDDRSAGSPSVSAFICEWNE